MYYVAEVKESDCAKYNCKQCVLFCPEPNTLMYHNYQTYRLGQLLKV